MDPCHTKLSTVLLSFLCIFSLLIAGAVAADDCNCKDDDYTYDHYNFYQIVPLCCLCPFNVSCAVPEPMRPNYFVADFSANIQSGPAPLTVHFQDWSFGEPDTWSWDFGDGSGSSVPNPVHTYTAPGSYTVTLTITRAYVDYNYYREESRTVSKPGFIQVMGSSSAIQQSAAPGTGSTGTEPCNSCNQPDVWKSLPGKTPVYRYTDWASPGEELMDAMSERTATYETSPTGTSPGGEEKTDPKAAIFSQKRQSARTSVLPLMKR